MKTFIILFVIAVCLPVNAQRVQENVKQKEAVLEVSQAVPEESAPEEKKAESDKVSSGKANGASRKQ